MVTAISQILRLPVTCPNAEEELSAPCAPPPVPQPPHGCKQSCTVRIPALGAPRQHSTATEPPGTAPAIESLANATAISTAAN